MFNYKPQGVCSKKINVILDKNDKVESIEFIGGCQGNLAGLCALCKGMDAHDIIQRLKGTRCGSRHTSCPDQLSIALEKALQDSKRNAP